MWKVLKSGQTWWNTWNLRDVLWEPNHQPTMTVTGQTYHPSKWWFWFWGSLIIGLICHIILELCMEYINQFQFLDDVVSGNGPVTQELHTQGSEALIVRGVTFPPILYKNWNKHLTTVCLCTSVLRDSQMIENIYQNHSKHFEQIHRGVPIPFDTSVIYTCQSRSFIAARIYRRLFLDILKVHHHPTSDRCFRRKTSLTQGSSN